MGEGTEFQVKEKEWAHITWPATKNEAKSSKRFQLLDQVVVSMKAGKQLFKINGTIVRPDSIEGQNIPATSGFATEDV